VGDCKALRVGIVSENRFGWRKLEGGDGKEKVSLVGVGVVAEVASWRGRGVWMAMVVVVAKSCGRERNRSDQFFPD
jgi:hypothetical protein